MAGDCCATLVGSTVAQEWRSRTAWLTHLAKDQLHLTRFAFEPSNSLQCPPNESVTYAMETAGQKAFNKLRPPCVELSQVALQFRAKQAAVKSVLQCLEKVEATLAPLADASALDAKLAEYVFFPLSHVFNAAPRLSSRCLELAVRCLCILVATGWRHSLAPEMGHQLLLLMVLLAGGSPSQSNREPPTDDLKVVCYRTMAAIVKCITKPRANVAAFGNMKSATIVDQIVYLLLESISDADDEIVQLEASIALRSILEAIHDRALLASLLPRTVSTIVKATKPNGAIRRKPRVLESNLRLLTETLRAVVSDEVAFPGAQDATTSKPSKETHDKSEAEVLDESWLKATSSQLQIAFTQLSKLRYHERIEVKEALLHLALMIVKECRTSLPNSSRTMLEIIIILAGSEDGVGLAATGEMKLLLTTEPAIVNEVKSLLYDWSLSLSRIMQNSEDQQKERMVLQLRTAYRLLSIATPSSDMLAISAIDTLIEGVSAAVQQFSLPQQQRIREEVRASVEIHDSSTLSKLGDYPAILFTHRSQIRSTKCLEDFISDVASEDRWQLATRATISKIPDASLTTKLASMWTALRLLRARNQYVELDDLVHFEAIDDFANSKPYLISDLYSCALDVLAENVSDGPTDSRLTALSLECVSLQAEQLGKSYRPELIDTLYAVLGLLSSPLSELQMHAIATLNRLTKACGYSSTNIMLVENVDYLVNSIAIKLNSFELSPQGPRVLLMMIKLCGATLLPYLDDLIGTIFTALDSFHGYTDLVELLFEVLKTIVEESAKQPQLAITNGAQVPNHHRNSEKISTVESICSDLTTFRDRQHKLDIEHHERVRNFPRRPWSANLDQSTGQITEIDNDAPKELQKDGEDSDLGARPTRKEVSEKSPSKAYRLLLNISQATVPHLNSPSPRVRLTLLQLLSRISPLLSRDEDSFLPLINAVWPVVIGRLFSAIGEDGDGESGYNVIAAAETMSRLCEGAGDFMSSRIEDIFPRLQVLFKTVFARARGSDRSRATASSREQAASATSLALHGAVDLQIVSKESVAGDLIGQTSSVAASGLIRSTDSQILEALLLLWVSILNHIRISDEHGEAILEMLSPIIDDPERKQVRQALELWNSDAVWLLDQRKAITQEHRAAFRDLSDHSYQCAGLGGLEGDWNGVGLIPVVF